MKTLLKGGSVASGGGAAQLDVLVDGEKMSKSLGNVIYADDLVRLFGVDAVRY